MRSLTRDTITLDWLKGQKACCGQVDLFSDLFGDSVVITPDVIMKAATAGLDLNWVSERVLTAPAWAAYEQAIAVAWAAYEQALAAAWAAYQQALAAARAAYEQARAAAWAAYEQARAPAWAAYEQARDAAWAAYQQAAAAALIRVIFEDANDDRP